jgi:hypothetical protein
MSSKRNEIIERDVKKELPLFVRTISTYNTAECAVALQHVIALYQQLRHYYSTPELFARMEAEEQSIIYRNNIINSIKKGMRTVEFLD